VKIFVELCPDLGIVLTQFRRPQPDIGQWQKDGGVQLTQPLDRGDFQDRARRS
jgi:hypothetical protein